MTSPTEEGLWDEQAADWAELQEAQCRPLFAAALDGVGARPGTALLDVGCGSGVALEMAAARGARVSGLDGAAELLGIARRRVPDAVELKVGDMAALPFADGAFDVVTSFNALRYAADPVAVLTEFARVTAPGGTVCVGGWGEPPACETTRLLFAVVAALPRPPAGSQENAANTPTQVRAAMLGAGLEPRHVEVVPCPFVYRDLETAWRALGSTGLMRFAVAELGEPAVRELFDAHVVPSVLADGTVRQENVFEYSLARVPA